MEQQIQEYDARRPEAFKQSYLLRLYVTGFTPASTRTIAHLKTLCEEQLKGRFELEVIDVLQRRALGQGEQIIATATLVKLLPAPMQRVIGDLAGVSGKLFGLDVRPQRARPRSYPQT